MSIKVEKASLESRRMLRLWSRDICSHFSTSDFQCSACLTKCGQSVHITKQGMPCYEEETLWFGELQRVPKVSLDEDSPSCLCYSYCLL